MSDAASPSRASMLVLGVGNAMKGDDGVGPYVASLLNATGYESEDSLLRYEEPRVMAIDCAMTPENYTSVVRRLRPGLLVIVDAAEMGLRAGEYRVVPPHRIGSLGLSTHSMPLSLFMDYVGGIADRIVLIGVQPKSMALGYELSPEARKAGDDLVALLSEGRIDRLLPLD